MLNTEHTVYIGLGSNLDDPVAQVQRAFNELDALPNTQLQQYSSLYSSSPMGPQDQPDYINAVAQLTTTLSPHILLAELQAIEKAHQRVRNRHWGARTLDLDILLFAEQQLSDPDLTIPHPGISERLFVLLPLEQLNPSLVIPGLGTISELLSSLDRRGVNLL